MDDFAKINVKDLLHKLNIDCGEGLGGLYANVDDTMMPYASYCNIACGMHAGDIDTISATVELAAKHEVLIGAHPSYDDRANFGRVYMQLGHVELTQLIYDQIALVGRYCRWHDAALHHVKPHGALYNAAMKHEVEAQAIVDATVAYNRRLKIFAMPDSVLARLAISQGLEVMYEAFADRTYIDSTTLIPRSEPNATLLSAAEIVLQLTHLRQGFVINHEGTHIPLRVDTVCLHTDQEGILDLMRWLGAS